MELTKIGEEVSREGLYPGVFSGIEDTPEGFAIFFSMIAQDVTGEPLVLTEHGHKWVETAYAAHDEGMGAVIEAFRGASKSVVSNGLQNRTTTRLYEHGCACYPWRCRRHRTSYI